MSDDRARQRRLMQIKYKKRRRLAVLIAAVLVVVVVVILLIATGGGREKPSDPVIIGPTKPANALDIQPLYATYDYSKPVADAPAVDDAWFDDALVIGDSRADGLSIYGILPRADIAAGSSVSVAGALERTYTVDGAETTLSGLLAAKRYGKIYLVLGVNEVGWLPTADFKASYGALVDAIRAAQPDAAIYLQSIIPVVSSLDWGDAIRSYNSAIQDIAFQKSVYYIDVYSAYADDAGALPASADGGDGVNLSVDSYSTWLAYLKTHTVNREMYKN